MALIPIQGGQKTLSGIPYLPNALAPIPGHLDYVGGLRVRSGRETDSGANNRKMKTVTKDRDLGFGAWTA